MHILFLTRRFYPDIGGVEKHVFELSKELLKRKHKVTIIVEMPVSLPALNFEFYEGITIIRITTGKEDRFKKFRIWKEMWRIRSTILSADIVHCHDVFFWYLPFRFLFFDKPVYTTFHGYEGYPLSQKAIRMRKISEILSWGNICIGDYIAKWYGTKPTFVSYGAVSKTTLQLKSKANIKKESAVFIGRLDEQTNIIEYVKGVSLLKKKYPTFDLTVVGDGPFKNKVKHLVNVIGFKSEPELYLPTSHFAFISRYLATMEAMAVKKLVFVMYDNPLKRDCFKLAPYRDWIVMVKNEKELYEKVIYYYNHPDEEKKLTDRAYEWVKDQSWERMTQTYINLWV